MDLSSLMKRQRKLAESMTATTSELLIEVADKVDELRDQICNMECECLEDMMCQGCLIRDRFWGNEE